jgi:hypothetical protein
MGVRPAQDYLPINGTLYIRQLIFTVNNLAIFEENYSPLEFNVIREGCTQRFLYFITPSPVFEDVHLIPLEICQFFDSDYASIRWLTVINSFAYSLFDQPGFGATEHHQQ